MPFLWFGTFFFLTGFPFPVGEAPDEILSNGHFVPSVTISCLLLGGAVHG